MCAQNEGQQYLKACAKFIIGELRLALLVLLLRFRRLEFFRKAVVAIVTDGVAEVGEGVIPSLLSGQALSAAKDLWRHSSSHLASRGLADFGGISSCLFIAICSQSRSISNLRASQDFCFRSSGCCHRQESLC